MPIDPWRKFHRFIDVIGLARQEKHFKQSLQSLSNSLGFESYVYLSLRSGTGFALSNYPQEWQDRYFRQSYQRLDPVIATAKRRWAPFAWSVSERPFLHKTRRQFAKEAHRFGIRCGLTIPIPAGFGHISMLTFASASATVSKEQQDCVPALTVASLTHAFVTLRHPSRSASSAIRLTPQEALCLRWAAEGKSMHETAALLGIKYNSVRSYLDNAREKLGAVTLIQAAAMATRLNLI